MKPLDDRSWALVKARKAGAPFLVGVRTTGIFCRTGCPARLPNRENMVLLTDAREAAAAGFRPCLKCHPVGTDPVLKTAIALARAIETAPDQGWGTREVETACGQPAKTVRRRFRETFGLTPVAFRDAVRLRRFKKSLKEGETVTDATYEAGFGGPAQRHQTARALGMTPSAYARGGAGEEIRYRVAESALGPVLVAGTAKGICSIRFLRGGEDGGEDGAETLAAEYPNARLEEAGAESDVDLWTGAIVTFLEEGGLRPDLPLDLRGTPFQMRVWQALQSLGPGETVSYGELAARLGDPKKARAVGGANGKNPVPIIVPCHLVLASGGRLGGYAGGLDKKRALLALEGVEVEGE